MIYREWIADRKLKKEAAYGKCKHYCEMMLRFFPELKLVRGYYLDCIWGERQHWWLETPEKRVVDPTHIQFPDPNGRYVEWDDSLPDPTGKCPNCGGLCYHNKYCCCDKCDAEFLASLYA